MLSFCGLLWTITCDDFFKDFVLINYRILQFQSRLYNAMNKFYHPPMVQQDIIITFYLMIECNLGSRFRQHCEIPPTEIIPRLNTFDDDKLSML